MASKYPFSEGDKVTYRLNATEEFTRTGIIRGLATTELAIVGFVFVVEDTTGEYPSPTYPFSCIPVCEIHLRKVSLQ
jgi:hypothetical protein